MQNLTKKEALIKLQETQNQLKELELYISNVSNEYSIEDIISLDIAEEILKNCKEHIKCTENQFPLKKYWNLYQLYTIQNAINYIDNNNQFWTPDWNDKNEYKYYPYFEFKNNGWVFGCSDYHGWFSDGYASFALKTKNGSDYLGKTFIYLFH